VIIDFEGNQRGRSRACQIEKTVPAEMSPGCCARSITQHIARLVRASSDRALLPWIEGWSRLVGQTFLDAWSEITETRRSSRAHQ
jgi:hypothetical protein